MRVQDSSKNLLIRVATLNDLDRLTDLHWASFGPEEHIPVMLGKPYVRATYRWLITSNQSYCLVAEIDGKLIGLVSVCDRSFTRPMFLACLPEFIISLIRSPRLIFEKSLWGRLLRRPEASEVAKRIINQPGFAQLTVIAVDAEYRGTGVFPALSEAVKNLSKERGSVALRAGVYKSNQASIKAFSRNGWVEVPELETKDTFFYVYYADPDFPNRLDITPGSP